MADLREQFDNPEEAMRTMWAGIQKHLHTSLVCIVAEDSDGKTVKLQPAIKQTVDDQTYGQTTYENFPLLLDVPVHFSGGGGTTFTHPIKKGDEGVALFMGRPHDTWRQSGGTQQQIWNRMHSLSDAIFIPGVRSMPRDLSNISTESSQMRSDDGNHLVDLHPVNGITHRSTMAVTLHAPSLVHIGDLTLKPDPETGKGGNMTIQASPDGSNGTLTVAKAVTAQTVTAPSGKVGV